MSAKQNLLVAKKSLQNIVGKSYEENYILNNWNKSFYIKTNKRLCG